MDDIGYKDHGYSFQILVSYEWVVADTNHLQQDLSILSPANSRLFAVANISFNLR